MSVVLCAIVFSPALFAEAWKITPTVTLDEIYHNNIYLANTPGDPVLETSLKGVLAFSRLTERNAMTARLHTNFSNQARENQYLTFNARHKTELSGFVLNGLYRRDSTMRTIVESLGGTVDDDIDEALVQVELRRNTLQLRPGVNYRYSKRLLFAVNYGFSTVFYDNNKIGTGVFDYDRHTVNPSLVWNINEREAIKATLAFSRFRSIENLDTTVDSREFTAGYERKISEITFAGFDAGLRDSSVESDAKNTVSTGYVMRLNMNTRTELGKYLAVLEHDIQPSGLGSLIESTQLQFNVKYKLSTRMLGSLNLRAFEQKSLATSQSQTRYYFYVVPDVNWKLTRWWSVGAGYRYRLKEQLDSDNDAESHAVLLTVKYSKEIAVD